MKTYLEFINEYYRGSQKNPAEYDNSQYCVYSNRKDFDDYWSNMPTDWLDAYKRKYFYKREPALKYLNDLSKTNLKEAFLTKKEKIDGIYRPNSEYYLEKWWINPNNEKMEYWDTICADKPEIYEKYLFGLNNIGIYIAKLDFKQVDYIKKYLLSEEKYKKIWQEIIKYCPKLDTGAEMGNLGF